MSRHSLKYLIKAATDKSSLLVYLVTAAGYRNGNETDLVADQGTLAPLRHQMQLNEPIAIRLLGHSVSARGSAASTAHAALCVNSTSSGAGPTAQVADGPDAVGWPSAFSS